MRYVLNRTAATSGDTVTEPAQETLTHAVTPLPLSLGPTEGRHAARRREPVAAGR